jgi:hypothetical protein
MSIPTSESDVDSTISSTHDESSSSSSHTKSIFAIAQLESKRKLLGSQIGSLQAQQKELRSTFVAAIDGQRAKIGGAAEASSVSFSLFSVGQKLTWFRSPLGTET